MRWVWLLILAGCGAVPTVPSTGQAPVTPQVERLRQLHDQARGGVLGRTGGLDRMAQSHAQKMAETRTMSHDGAGDGSFSTRLRQFGISGSKAGENIAAGQQTPEAAVQAWLNSPGHRRNIMDPVFTHAGYGAAKSDKWYWCAVFARLGVGASNEDYTTPGGIDER